MTRNYLDDLLAMPVILGLTRTALRFLYQSKSWELEFPMIALSYILVALIFEGILPIFSSQFTADYLDLICYGAGGVLYQSLLELDHAHK